MSRRGRAWLGVDIGTTAIALALKYDIMLSYENET